MFKTKTTSLVLLSLLTIVSTGCGLLDAGQSSAPPPDSGILAQGNPPVEPTATPVVDLQTDTEGRPTPLPADAPIEAGSASPGEVLFVRGGQVFAITVETAQERQLTSFEPGKALRELKVSPDARYLVFSIDAAVLGLLDLTAGQLRTLSADEPGIVSSLVWAADSSAVYYQRTALDTETSQPIRSSLIRLEVTADPPVEEELISVDFAEGREISPRFAFPDGTLLVTETNPFADELSTNLYLFSGGELAPVGADGVNPSLLLDIAIDGTSALFLDQADPGALLYALFDPETGFSSPLAIETGTAYIYQAARFTTGGNVLALRQPSDAPVGANEVVLFDAGEDYTPTLLAPTGDYNNLSLAWHPAGLAVVARLPLEEGVMEVWTLPTDGEPSLLAEGEQPVVVTAR